MTEIKSWWQGLAPATKALVAIFTVGAGLGAGSFGLGRGTVDIADKLAQTDRNTAAIIAINTRVSIIEQQLEDFNTAQLAAHSAILCYLEALSEESVIGSVGFKKCAVLAAAASDGRSK